MSNNTQNEVLFQRMEGTQAVVIKKLQSFNLSLLKDSSMIST